MFIFLPVDAVKGWTECEIKTWKRNESNCAREDGILGTLWPGQWWGRRAEKDKVYIILYVHILLYLLTVKPVKSN